jgi:hypothetical protein
MRPWNNGKMEYWNIGSNTIRFRSTPFDSQVRFRLRVKTHHSIIPMFHHSNH